MPYNLRNFDGRAFATIADGVVDRQSSSSLYLIGKDVSGYGTFQNDNFLFLLENFAGTIEPSNKVQGQIWFDKTVGILKPKVYDGTEWKILSTIVSSSIAPSNSRLGDLWFDSANNQLNVMSTSTYTLIGPEKLTGFDVTKFVSKGIRDTNGSEHACMLMYVDGEILGVVSFEEFDVLAEEDLYIAGITQVRKGFTLVAGASIKTDVPYASQQVNEVITGSWLFNSGINIGSGRMSMSGNSLLISNTSTSREILIDAAAIMPSGTVSLGSSSAKFNKMFTSELSGGTSISSVSLTGQFELSNSSKLFPAADGTISLGAGNARWASIFTKSLDAGASNNNGTIVGNWALGAASSLNVSAGTLVTDTLSTGDAGLPGTITGSWSLTNDSAITFNSGTLNLGTGNLDVTSGTLKSRTLTAGSISTEGIITGAWKLAAGSELNTLAGTLAADTLTTGNTGNAGTITGAWKVSSNSSFEFDENSSLKLLANTSIDARLGTLFSKSLSAGTAATNASIVGNWVVSASSIIDTRLGSLFSTAVTTGNVNTDGVFTGAWKLSDSSSLQLRQNSSIDARLGSLMSRTLSAGTAATSASITGNWVISADSVIDTTAGVLKSTTLTTGSSTTDGAITGKWTLTSGSRLDATWGDIAEKYTADEIYEPGTVVMFGGTHEVTLAFGSQSTKVAGIVTTYPAQVLNSNIEHAVDIALIGRVPCKVVGKIEKGDLLVTSHIAGVATSTTFPRTGSLIAKALEEYNSTEIGTIEVMVVRG